LGFTRRWFKRHSQQRLPLLLSLAKRRPWRLTRAAAEQAERDLEAELAESLQERTLESLDFDYVVEKLREQCYTVVGAAMAEDPADLLAASAEEAKELYDMVVELASLDDADLKLDEPLDIQEKVDACARGNVLEAPDVAAIEAAIQVLLKLRNGLEYAAAGGLDIPILLRIVAAIELPDELLDLVLEAFTEDGELSEAKFPDIAEKRSRVKELEDQCGSEIRKVLSSGKYTQYLSDDGYIQMGGHFVLSVRPQHWRKVGQRFDESRSGRTVYTEPHELVALTSELTELQKELKFLVRRILGRMCVAVSRSSEAIKACLEAAGRIDLGRARLFLGEDMEGEVPEVRDEGVISVQHARNPCLILRGGTSVVGNPLELSHRPQGLILSGPNAGGKTVVLKTAGLLALLARCGIPVPTGESPRVDFFDVVVAEVGDMQTIVDDLSTYSAHLVASRIMLGLSADSGSHALVMVDEAGTGTDPMQGAALARAILEAFLERGARVVATTHSMQLKNWALEDPRTEIAAMEYKRGRPTFRLTHNAVGESHAIETARRLELPSAVVLRAEELLDEDQRSLLSLQRKAEELERQLQHQIQRTKEREEQAVAAKKLTQEKDQQLEAKEQELAATEASLVARQERLRSQLLAEHQARVDAHERKLETILSGLKKDDSGGKARLQVVGNAIQDLRLERDEVAEAAYQAQQRAKLVPGALAAYDDLRVGEWVMVLARTAWYGFKGQVQQIQSGGAGRPVRVKVRVEGSGNVVDVEKTELGKTSAPPPRLPVGQQRRTKKKQQPARDYSKLVNSW